MEFIYEYGLFLAQAATLVIAVLVVVAGLVAIGHRQRAEQHEGHIEIRNLNERYGQVGDSIQHVVSDPQDWKARRKAEKKADKEKRSPERIEKIINKSCLTVSGRQQAQAVLLTEK